MKKLKLLLISLSLFIPSLSFAQGGDDPIPGIDIIIKYVSGEPITNFSLKGKEMEPQNKKMSFNNRREYLIKRMLTRLNKINKKNKWKVEWHKVLYRGLSQVWCSPKECHNTMLIISLGVPKEPNASNIRFKLDSKILTEWATKTK